jgi:hypothetical protein
MRRIVGDLELAWGVVAMVTDAAAKLLDEDSGDGFGDVEKDDSLKAT